MEPAEIGKKLKQMYPQYAKVDDAILGQKYILKYGDKGLQSLGLSTSDIDKDATALRKEYDSLVETKNYKEIKKQYGNMKSAGETGAGDVSIMYSYIKMLDPTSVVREGELALAAKAAGLPDNVVKAAEKLDKKGKGLGPEMRKNMIAEGARIYNNAAETQKEVASRYSGYASDMGIEAKSVVGNFEDIKTVEIPEYKKEETSTGFLGGIKGLFGQMQGDIETGNLRQAGRRAMFPLVNIYDPAKALEEGDVRAGYNPTGGKAASEVLMGILAGQGLSKARALIGKKGVKETAKMVTNPRGALGTAERKAAEEAAKKGAKVNTGRIVEAGKTLTKSDPEAMSILEKHIPAIKSAKSPVDLLERLKVWKKAWTQAGKVGKSSRAQLFETLYNAGRAELANTAPQASKYRNIINLTYQAPKKAKQIGWETLKLGGLAKILGF